MSPDNQGYQPAGRPHKPAIMSISLEKSVRIEQIQPCTADRWLAAASYRRCGILLIGDIHVFRHEITQSGILNLGTRFILITLSCHCKEHDCSKLLVILRLRAVSRGEIPDFLDKHVYAYICSRLILRLTRSSAMSCNSILYVTYSVELTIYCVRKRKTAAARRARTGIAGYG